MYITHHQKRGGSLYCVKYTYFWKRNSDIYSRPAPPSPAERTNPIYGETCGIIPRPSIIDHRERRRRPAYFGSRHQIYCLAK